MSTSIFASDAPTYRGKIILVVDKSVASDSKVAPKIARLTQDLEGDGWRVLRHDVDRGPEVPGDASQGPANPGDIANVPAAYTLWAQQNAPRVREIRALIKSDYDADPNNVKNVFLIGHVPVPYSGYDDDGTVGGHYSGAKPADAFYGEMKGWYGQGGWSDALTDNGFFGGGDNVPWQVINLPNDGKFDQDQMPLPMELGVGRADFIYMSEFNVNETTLISRYLDKDHDFRCGNFTVPRKAFFAGQLETVPDGANYVLGPENVTQNYNDNWMDGDPYLWFLNVSDPSHSYLLGFAGGRYNGGMMGIGGSASPDPNDFYSSDSRVVFMSLAGSFINNWDNNRDVLKAPLANPYDPANGRFGYGLTSIWEIGLDQESLTKRALGTTIGEAVYAGYSGGVNYSLMGDPSLRLHTVLPPTSLIAAATGSSVSLSWTTSTDPCVTGYNVYCAPTQDGPFALVNTGGAITGYSSGNSYNITRPVAGSSGYVPDNFYMVRAVKTESIPSISNPYVGSYVNMSEGQIVQVPGNTINYLAILNQPANEVVTANTLDGTTNSVAFSVDAVACDATGDNQLEYLWYLNGQPISSSDPHVTGANTRSILIRGVHTSDAGVYSVRVSHLGVLNPDGVNCIMGTSTTATLTVNSQSPVANADTFTAYRGTPIDLNVLANDVPGVSGPSMSVASVSQLSNPSAGILSINADQTIHFCPSETFVGTVTFSYVMEDAPGNFSQATVTVNVQYHPDDQPPQISAIENQELAAGSTISVPFTVSDEYTPSQYLVPTLSWPGESIYCQVVWNGGSPELQILGNMPANNVPVILEYTDQDLKSSTVTFNVTVSPNVNQPSLSSISYNSGVFAFSISQNPNTTWTVYSSVDLNNWTEAGTVTLDGNGVGSFTDSSIKNLLCKYYKLSNGTYTSQAIGYEHELVPPGAAAPIANQLISPENTLDGLFNQGSSHTMPDGMTLPSGTQIYVLQGGGGIMYTWNGASWVDQNSQPSGDVALAPGGGALMYNYGSGALMLTFVGLVAEGQFAIPLQPGTSYISAVVPQSGTFSQLFNYSPTQLDTISLWDASQGQFVEYAQYYNVSPGYPAGWYSYASDWNDLIDPPIQAGQPFLLHSSSTGVNTMTESYSDAGGVVPSLAEGAISSSSFEFDISGTPATTWTVYWSEDLNNWTAVGTVTLDDSGAGSFTDNDINNSMYKFYKLSNGTLTSQAIGYQREIVPPGADLAIANQLMSPQNTLDGLFNLGGNHAMPDGTVLPSGTQIIKQSGASDQTYTWNGTAWNDSNNQPAGSVTMMPGEGAEMWNYGSSSLTLTFVGLVSEGQFDIPLSSSPTGYHWISAIAPQSGTFSELFNYKPTQLDIICLWDVNQQNFVVYAQYYNASPGYPAGWYSVSSGLNDLVDPPLQTGQSFIIDNTASGENNLIETYFPSE